MKKIKANKPKLVNTRKVLRKEKRKQKKINRQEHYLKKKTVLSELKSTPGKFVKRPPEIENIKDDSKNIKVKPQQESSQDVLMRQRQKELKEAEKLKSQMDKQRKQMMVKANEDEDKIIKKLEKQLGLNKSKNKNNYFADDGLDYLLEICDRATSEQIVAAEKHLADVEKDSDFEEDLAAVTGKKIPKKKVKDKSKKSNNIDEDENSDNEMDCDDEPLTDDSDDGDDDEAVTGDESEGSNDFEDENLSDSDNSENDKSDGSELHKEEQIPKLKNKLQTKSKKEKIVSESELSKVFSDDEVSHLSGDEDISGFSDDEENIENKTESKEKPDVWEDIYGRKRDKEGNVIKEEKGIYIPPHLRNKDSASDKELAQIKRQIKSVLNKLAGTNLHWASTSIENLYSSNSRNSVNTALTQLWLEAAVSEAITPQRMLVEHTALISILHANVGSEIGAHFLEELSRKFDDMMQTPQPVENKMLDNLLSCLALLYSFKIYHVSLLYDILNRLVKELSEKNIDCVLAILRNVGGVLRKEEPAALKTFIHDTQSKIAKMNEDADSGSRIKYLLEVLLAVKNNNLNKIPNYDPSYVEHLKKMCRGIVRRGNYVTPLNIRLEDLLKAHERGKWWVVGSAWEGAGGGAGGVGVSAGGVGVSAGGVGVSAGGVGVSAGGVGVSAGGVGVSAGGVGVSAGGVGVSAGGVGVSAGGVGVSAGGVGVSAGGVGVSAGGVGVSAGGVGVSAGGGAAAPSADQKLLELAKKQRMNTDVRRSIFCVIMSAEDFMDAFEKLQHLGLKGQQEREIVHVLLACCLNEKTYNPYYAVLGQKLCDVDRKYQLSIQYSVWDKIKDIESLSKQAMTNLAQFLIHLIMEKGLPLSVLKIIQFSDLNKKTVKFMRQILLAILMNADLQISLEVFHRISKPPKLHMFRESLRLFIQHFLIKNAGKKTSVLSEDEMATLKERAIEVDKILTMYENKLRL